MTPADIGDWLATAGHLAVSGAAGWLLLRWCREIGRIDRRLAFIVALGTLARLGFGAALFWVSYLDLHAAASLHGGDGFWDIAPDARYYFLTAATVAEHGWPALDTTAASPSFVATLALWMRLVGPLPTAVVLLNALFCVGSCRLIASTLGPAPSSLSVKAVAVIMAGLALAPAAAIFSAQGLKDQFTTFMLVLGAVGAFRFLRRDDGVGGRQGRLAGWLMFLAAVFLVSGTRAYVGVFMIAAFASAAVWAAVRSPASRGRRLVLAIVATMALWPPFMAGAGPYYAQYGGMIAALLPPQLTPFVPAPVTRLVTTGLVASSVKARTPRAVFESAREGFDQTAGGTSLVAPGSHDGPVVRFAKGLAATFLPMSALKAVGLFRFSGGRGLLVVTDVDTVFNLVLTVCVAALMIRWLDRRSHPTYVAYATVLVIALTVPMIYVVSNFGTLVRLRIMVMTLISLVLLGLMDERPARTQ